MMSRFLNEKLAEDDPDMKFYVLGRGTPNANNFLNLASVKLTGTDANAWRAASPAALATAMNIPDITATAMQDAFDGQFSPEVGGSVYEYAAIRMTPVSNILIGGLKINKDAQVLRQGTPIKGLYAAGETASGQFFYMCYPTSGGQVSLANSFGYCAGYHAATGNSAPGSLPAR